MVSVVRIRVVHCHPAHKPVTCKYLVLLIFENIINRRVVYTWNEAKTFLEHEYNNVTTERLHYKTINKEYN